MTSRALHLRDRRRTVWLGVFALLFQAWLPLVHHPASFFTSDGEATAGSEILVLCTAAGLVREKVPAGDQAPVHRLPPCPVCRILHTMGSFTPPPAPILIVGAAVFLHYIVWPNAPSCPSRFEPAARPRAPPPSI